jgi:hypothetical protein
MPLTTREVGITANMGSRRKQGIEVQKEAEIRAERELSLWLPICQNLVLPLRRTSFTVIRTIRRSRRTFRLSPLNTTSLALRLLILEGESKFDWMRVRMKGKTLFIHMN